MTKFRLTCRKRGADIAPSGFDAGKQGKGKKRPVLVDPLGLFMRRLAFDIPQRFRPLDKLLLIEHLELLRSWQVTIEDFLIVKT